MIISWSSNISLLNQHFRVDFYLLWEMLISRRLCRSFHLVLTLSFINVTMLRKANRHEKYSIKFLHEEYELKKKFVRSIIRYRACNYDLWWSLSFLSLSYWTAGERSVIVCWYWIRIVWSIKIDLAKCNKMFDANQRMVDLFLSDQTRTDSSSIVFKWIMTT